jgi:type IV pilus modification protein PilV
LNLIIKSKGFSLIEVLIALIILSVSLLALASLMLQTTNNNSFGSHMTEAATFGQDKLEELRATPWTNLISGTDVKPGSTGSNYTRTWNIATNGAGNLRTISITIRWTDKINHTITLLSAVGN